MSTKSLVGRLVTQNRRALTDAELAQVSVGGFYTGMALFGGAAAGAAGYYAYGRASRAVKQKYQDLKKQAHSNTLGY